VRVAIHQPQYLPWLGYLEKLDQADLFVFLDTVQYKKHEWQNRNRIKTPQGSQWLTVPVFDRFPERIGAVEIDNRLDWRRKHRQALAIHYGRAPGFARFREVVEAILDRPWARLADLNIALVEALSGALGITTKTVRASTLDASDDPTGRLVDLCRACGASAYLAGADGARYMDLERFRGAGIAVWTQAYAHPAYPQRYGPFRSHLSVVDLLFNQGAASLAVLRSGSRWMRP
jgi:hypothetical protein